MRIIFALAALASLASAADPVKLVASPASAPAKSDSVPLDAGKFLWLSCPEYAGALTWDITGGEAVSIFPVKADSSFPGYKQGGTKAELHTAPKSQSEVLAVFGESAGVVSIAAWGVKENKPVKLAVITIAVGGARPPPPDPKPDPKPDPQPFTGKWRILIVEETADAANNRGQFLGDKALNDYIHAKCSSKPRIVDQDVKDATNKPPKDMAPWLNMAKGKSLPQLFVVGDDGTIIWTGNLPGTPADTLLLLKSIGG